MAEITKTERILNLVSFLFKARRRLISWKEVRENVVGYDDGGTAESLRRRFERDKKFLETLGIEVEYVSGAAGAPSGYRILRERTFVPPVEITPGERLLLAAVARAASRKLGDTPLARHLHAALLKIHYHDSGEVEDESSAEASPPAWLAPAGAVQGNPSDALFGAIEVLGQAVVLRKTVAFEYRSAAGDSPPSRRVLAPYGLFTRDQFAWYVVGRCQRAASLRTFRLDRIRGPVEWVSPRGEDPDFESPDAFDLEAYASRPAWRFEEGDDPTPARVAFDAALFWRAAEHPDALDVVEHEDGSGEATFRVSNAEAFVRWVLSFGRHARILESPPGFLEILRARLSGAIASGRPAP